MISAADIAAASAAVIPVEEIFRERCEARAILWTAGEYSLHEAVDLLRADAERSGLIAEIGQDGVQAIMATAFAAVRIEADQVPALDDGNGNNNADESRAATSTIEAADFLVRQNDPARLKTWLAKHSADERAAILKHIRRGKG
jgi:hypothetical protein